MRQPRQVRGIAELAATPEREDTLNDHQSPGIVERPTDDSILIRLLVSAQKESQATAAGKPLPAGPRPFALFVERTQRPLAQKVLGKVHGDRHRCEDLVQETYLKVWKGLLR